MFAVGSNLDALDLSEECDGAADAAIVGGGVVIMAEKNSARSEHGVGHVDI